MIEDKYALLRTPCYIFDISEIHRSITGFRDGLQIYFNNIEIGYSVKTNSLPYALKKAKELGCKAEVVSFDEYELAKKCGFSNSEIIYNGPLKSKETFLEAVEGDAIVNIECKREIDWLNELPKDKRVYKVGLRLNINISKVSPEDADGEDDNSRFGFDVESGEFSEALERLKKLSNVRLCGIHIHRTSHSRSLRFYRNSIDYACGIIEKYNLDLDYLDVGGGYFGIFRNAPTFEEYSDTFYEVLKSHGLQNLTVIVEPGNALVASAFSFLTEVIDTKSVGNIRFVNTNGSRNDIDPFFRKTSYLYEIIPSTIVENRPVEVLQIIGGCTCLEYDRLFELKKTFRLCVGDRILYNNVGAYTLTLSPLFIRMLPKVYCKENGEYKLIRDSWGAQELMTKSIL